MKKMLVAMCLVLGGCAMLGAVVNPRYFSSLVVGGTSGLVVDNEGNLVTTGSISTTGAINAPNHLVPASFYNGSTELMATVQDFGGVGGIVSTGLVAAGNLDENHAILTTEGDDAAAVVLGDAVSETEAVIAFDASDEALTVMLDNDSADTVFRVVNTEPGRAADIELDGQIKGTGSTLNLTAGVGVETDVPFTAEGVTVSSKGAVLFTEDDTWVVPDHITQVEIIAVSGGQGGGGGASETNNGAGNVASGFPEDHQTTVEGSTSGSLIATLSGGAQAKGGRASGPGGVGGYSGEYGVDGTGWASGGGRAYSPLGSAFYGGAGGLGADGGGGGGGGRIFWDHIVANVTAGETLTITVGEGFAGAAGGAGTPAGTAGEAGTDGAVLIRW